MRLWKKILLGVVVIILSVIALFVIFIGPWPTYSAGFENASYYKENLEAIKTHAKMNDITANPGQLQAGWGVCDMTPEAGLPMAGYGARHNIKEYLLGDEPTGLTTGAHDRLHVKAVALSDGKDTVVIVGSDMLLTPPNVADGVYAAVAAKTPLTANDILFGASHTHDGPGAWGPGLAAFVTGGTYDPQIVEFLTKAFTNAVLDAYNSLAPAKLAYGAFDAKEFIRNRARDAAIDTRFNYLILEKENGKRCILTRYSAHPTTVGSRFLQFTAEFPGFMQTALEQTLPNTTVAYIGGSLGSSGPRSPEGPDDISRAKAMGVALAQKFLENVDMETLDWKTNVDVAAIGIPLQLPPFQLRVSQGLRLSSMLPKLLGVPHEARMQSVRIGDLYLVGMPADFSGEISLDWSNWAKANGFTLWPTSFCYGYIGYVSPDKYYNEPDATKEYETGLMSWVGPHQEAFFTALMKNMVESLKTSATG